MLTIIKKNQAIILLYLTFSLFYAYIAVLRHEAFQTREDLAVYHQIFWQLSKWQWPHSSFFWLNRPFFTDHVQPIYLILVPLFWVFSGAETLLVIQPFITLLAIFPIYWITMKIINSKGVAFILILLFSFSILTQNMLLYDFHEMAFIPPLLLFFYYFSMTQKTKYMSLILLAILFVKEDMGFLVSSIGLYILLFNKKLRIFGFCWFLVGLVYSFYVIQILIPSTGYGYIHTGLGESGSSPSNVIANFFINPLKYLQYFIDDPVKTETLFQTYAPYLFLPLLSPFSFILSFEQFAVRFWFLTRPTLWTTEYHYSAPIAAIIIIGLLSIFELIKKLKYGRSLISLICLIMLLLNLAQGINRSALRSVIDSQPWNIGDTYKSYNHAIALIPDNSSVQTHNFISPHVSGRKLIDYYKSSWNADYILVDLKIRFPTGSLITVDQNPYDFLYAIKQSTESGQYKLIFRDNGEDYYTVLLRKTTL